MTVVEYQVYKKFFKNRGFNQPSQMLHLRHFPNWNEFPNQVKICFSFHIFSHI